MFCYVEDIILIAIVAYSLFPYIVYIHTLKDVYSIAFKINLNITIQHLFFSAFQERYSIKNGISLALFHITIFIDHVYNFTQPGCTYKN